MAPTSEYPFHRPKRINWRSVALGVAIPVTVAAIVSMGSCVRSAWAAKESVADHEADVAALRSDDRAMMDSVRRQHSLDSALAERILDAVCSDRKSIRACK